MQGYVPVKNLLQEVSCFVASKVFSSVSVGNFLYFFQLWIIYENISFHDHVQGHGGITYKLSAEVSKLLLHCFTLHFCLLMCSHCLTQEGVTALEMFRLQKQQCCRPHKLSHCFGIIRTCLLCSEGGPNKYTCPVGARI